MSNRLAPKGDGLGDEGKYFAILRHGIERATSVAWSMVERLGAADAGNVVQMPGAAAPAAQTVVPAPEVKPLPPLPRVDRWCRRSVAR